MKKIGITLIIIKLLTNACPVFSQFTGGNGSGYDSDISVNYLLNETLYNDLQLISISEPIDSAILNVNTPYDLTFSLKNLGPYPILPEDTIFYDFNLGLIQVMNSYCFTSDTLQVNDTLQVTSNNFLLFTDTTGYEELCIALKNTSFASDSIYSNNSICHHVKISDPSGIYSLLEKPFISYYNADKKMLVVKTSSEIKYLILTDILGKLIPFHTENSPDEIRVFLNTTQTGIIFLNLATDNEISSLKILVY